MAVLEDLIKTLENLGGEGTLSQIYDEYAKVSSNPKPPTVRHYLQIYSSDSKKNYRGKGDHFFSVGVYGGGRWGLRNFEIFVQEDPNFDTITDRQRISINRIIRDTALCAEIKKLVDYKCQICSEQIVLPNGKKYAEAHHIRGLGEPHNGPDVEANILILCPNCHVKCDYKSIQISKEIIKNDQQNVGDEFINFHNDIYKSLHE